ncbi:ImmA/IrrE family metallo-endopeptidase [Haloparvum sedimenti]|uniref:ImmA/IrrE family metallo-endopeptidase n=1 Tax=Haloparvum sedimenti TaxID=1678448 RepID=UPI00071E9879|nr:ImmA/IrrE family metallo-endopeptidase [Haloparvum sedimenti]
MAAEPARDERVTFDDADSRSDRMHSTISDWIDELVTAVDDARASERFQAWLDVHQRFHDYSHRNTLLIALQFPEASKVAGYRTWQEEFDRHVQEGESAIWIWAPLISAKCPACGNSPSYHDDADCAYDDTPPEEWDEGVVGFKPVPVFDVSQTAGEPLPELETAADGEASALFPTLLNAAVDLGIEVRVRDPDDWSHGDANGVCAYPDEGPLVTLKEAEPAAMAGVLVHELAHALLHGDHDAPERAKREVEAEAVAYVVGRHFGLDMSGSAFYLAAWIGDETEVIEERLERISRTSERVIEAVAESRS